MQDYGILGYWRYFYFGKLPYTHPCIQHPLQRDLVAPMFFGETSIGFRVRVQGLGGEMSDRDLLVFDKYDAIGGCADSTRVYYP